MSTVVDETPPRSRLGRAFVLLLTVGAFAILLATPFFGCIQEEKVECAGGINVGGECFPKCEPDKCLEGNICVGHLCRLVCHSHRDCDWPRQECRPPAGDAAVSGDSLLVAEARTFGVCTDVGRFPLESTYGTPCPIGNECWASGCPNGLECDLNACPDAAGVPHPEQCIPDPVACAGKEPCNIGTCGKGGPPCVVVTCAPGECTPFFCSGKGEGDADAYCTHHDCRQDSDCPAGWYCGVTRDPHDICGPTCVGGSCSDDGDSCTFDGDCQKGNNSLCGTTEEPCIAPAQFNLDGKTLFEGDVCLLRRTCLEREPCVGCNHNLDCSGDPQMVCLDVAGEMVCAKFCGSDKDCLRDEICQTSYATCELTSTLGCGEPMPESPACPNFPCIGGVCRMADGMPGPACASSADCPRQGCIWRNVCVPAMGSCRGSGGFCEHCVDDTDCGVTEPPGRWLCSDRGDGEFACFDFSYPDECPSGSDDECPESPSGLRGTCLDEEEEVDPSSSSYHHCYLPYQEASGYVCWP